MGLVEQQDALWGRQLLIATGLVPVARAFLLHHKRLGIEPAEFVLILALLSLDWEQQTSSSVRVARMPSLSEIATEMGLSIETPTELATARRNVRRLIAKLEGKSLLERRVNRTTGRSGPSRHTTYRLEMLFDRLASIVRK